MDLLTPIQGVTLAVTETEIGWSNNADRSKTIYGIETEGSNTRTLAIELTPTVEALTSLKIYGRLAGSSTWLELVDAANDYTRVRENNYLRIMDVHTAGGVFINHDVANCPAGYIALVVLSVPPLFEIAVTGASAGGTCIVHGLAKGFGHRWPETYLPGIDPTTNAAKSIAYPHAELHGGNLFSYEDAVEVAASTTILFTITTPNTAKHSHLGFLVDGKSEFELRGYIDATPATAGTAPTAPGIINRNGNSTNTTGLVIRGGVAVGVGDIGDIFMRKHSGNGKQVGGVVGTVNELILKQNTVYLFALENFSTSANWLSWIVEWYDHTDRV